MESCGLHVSVDKPWLADSLDGLVTDSSDPTHPLGLVEIKNPFAARNLTLMEASKKSSFCLKKNKDSGNWTQLLLSNSNTTLLHRTTVV